jgi:hypothetical protein
MDNTDISDKVDETRSIKEMRDLVKELVEDGGNDLQFEDTTISLEGSRLYIKTTDEFLQLFAEELQNAEGFKDAHVDSRLPPMKPLEGNLYTIEEL